MDISLKAKVVTVTSPHTTTTYELYDRDNIFITSSTSTNDIDKYYLILTIDDMYLGQQLFARVIYNLEDGSEVAEELIRVGAEATNIIDFFPPIIDVVNVTGGIELTVRDKKRFNTLITEEPLVHIVVTNVTSGSIINEYTFKDTITLSLLEFQSDVSMIDVRGNLVYNSKRVSNYSRKVVLVHEKQLSISDSEYELHKPFRFNVLLDGINNTDKLKRKTTAICKIKHKYGIINVKPLAVDSMSFVTKIKLSIIDPILMVRVIAYDTILNETFEIKERGTE